MVFKNSLVPFLSGFSFIMRSYNNTTIAIASHILGFVFAL